MGTSHLFDIKRNKQRNIMRDKNIKKYFMCVWWKEDKEDELSICIKK